MSNDQSKPRFFDELAGKLGEWLLRRGEWFNVHPMGTRLAPHSVNPE
jgi:hypothetical protein